MLLLFISIYEYVLTRVCAFACVDYSSIPGKVHSPRRSNIVLSK